MPTRHSLLFQVYTVMCNLLSTSLLTQCLVAFKVHLPRPPSLPTECSRICITCFSSVVFRNVDKPCLIKNAFLLQTDFGDFNYTHIQSASLTVKIIKLTVPSAWTGHDLDFLISSRVVCTVKKSAPHFALCMCHQLPGSTYS